MKKNADNFMAFHGKFELTTKCLLYTHVHAHKHTGHTVLCASLFGQSKNDKENERNTCIENTKFDTQ